MRVHTVLTLFLCTLAVGCDDGVDDTDVDTNADTEVDSDTDTAAVTEIELMGTWMSFGDTHEITSESWEQSGSFDGVDYSSLFHIVDFDNDDRFAIAENDSDNEYNPDLYSRFDWTVNADGDFVYCQSAFDAATEADARAASADDADLAAGCGGFSWSPLDPVSE